MDLLRVLNFLLIITAAVAAIAWVVGNEVILIISLALLGVLIIIDLIVRSVRN